MDNNSSGDIRNGSGIVSGSEALTFPGDSRQAAVNEFQQLMLADDALDDLVAKLPAVIGRMVDADGAAVLLVVDEELVYRATAGIATPLAGRRLPASGLGAVAECQWSEPPAAAGDDWSQLVGSIGAETHLVAAISDGQRTIGAVQVVAAAGSRFAPGAAATLSLAGSLFGNLVQRLRSDTRLQRTEKQYRALFHGNPIPMWVFDIKTLQFLAVNNAAIRHYGYSRAEYLARKVTDDYSAGEAARFREALANLIDGANNIGCWRQRCRDGSFKTLEITAYPLVLDGIDTCLALADDITLRHTPEREWLRVNRAERMLRRCNEVLLHAGDEAALLRDIVEVVIDIGGYHSAWVGFAERDAGHGISVAAKGGFYHSYDLLDGVQLSWDASRPEGLGISGQTIREGRAMTCDDLSRAPGPREMVEKAEKLGVYSLLSLPLRGKDDVFGLLALYSTEKGNFPPEEIALCQELADNLAFGIEHQREVAERHRLEAAVLKVASGVSSARGPAFFQELALSIADAIAADACIISRLLPGEPHRVQSVASVHDGRILPPQTDGLVGTPCFNLLSLPEWVVEADVRKLYPDDAVLEEMQAESYVGMQLNNSEGRLIGTMCITYRTALRNRAFLIPVLRIFAARAAAELERQTVDAHIYEQAALLDKARDAILVRSLDYRITYWNKGAENLYGWTAEEVLGGLYGGHVEGEARALLEAANAETVATGEWRGQLRQQRKDGKTITVEAHWSLVRDDAGAPLAIFSIHTDISERLALEEQLRQSQRLESLGQLTGGVAHDFNNLLTVILGNAELLVEVLADNPRLGKLAEMIRNASQRGADLTQRLLAVARRQVLEPSDVDVNQLLMDMSDLLARTLHENIDICFHCAPDAWPALVDPGQLESAMLNLCINARDAMPNGGLLTIETANCHLEPDSIGRYPDLTPGSYLVIAVSDTGEGVPDEYLERIFDPFFTTKEKGKGTGLGLSMVYGFVKQSHGHINVYTEVGVGTTVKLYLPRADDDETAMPARSEGPGGDERCANASILLVEDDDMVRTFASQLLAARGYRVSIAENGPEALAMLGSGIEVDLLFTDVIMPGGMTGPQLAEQAVALRPGLRVLYTSGYTENAILRRHGFDTDIPLVTKPYRQSELIGKIEWVLSRESR